MRYDGWVRIRWLWSLWNVDYSFAVVHSEGTHWLFPHPFCHENCEQLASANRCISPWWEPHLVSEEPIDVRPLHTTSSNSHTIWLCSIVFPIRVDWNKYYLQYRKSIAGRPTEIYRIQHFDVALANSSNYYSMFDHVGSWNCSLVHTYWFAFVFSNLDSLVMAALQVFAMTTMADWRCYSHNNRAFSANQTTFSGRLFCLWFPPALSWPSLVLNRSQTFCLCMWGNRLIESAPHLRLHRPKLNAHE